MHAASAEEVCSTSKKKKKKKGKKKNNKKNKKKLPTRNTAVSTVAEIIIHTSGSLTVALYRIKM